MAPQLLAQISSGLYGRDIEESTRLKAVEYASQSFPRGLATGSAKDSPGRSLNSPGGYWEENCPGRAQLEEEAVYTLRVRRGRRSIPTNCPKEPNLRSLACSRFAQCRISRAMKGIAFEGE